jgi:NAD+ synthase (glutamine-hydrolysing)
MKKTSIDFSELGYFRIALFSPSVDIGNPEQNASLIVDLARQAELQGAQVAVYPELALTGYTCEDLFLSSELKDRARDSLIMLAQRSIGIKTVIVVGAPLTVTDRQYNCAVAVQDGKIIGAWPKTHLVNYGEFYEKRWFCSGLDVSESVAMGSHSFRLDSKQVIEIDGVKIGIEICEDLFSVIPPSCGMALTGAACILNLSASPENVGRAAYRVELVKQQSARLNCVYAYVSAGPMESTKDVVYSGHAIVAENGAILLNSERLNLKTTYSIVDVDMNKIANDRGKNMTFQNTKVPYLAPVIRTSTGIVLRDSLRIYDRYPFVPQDSSELRSRSAEIIKIQSTGLARRVISCGAKKVVVGLSGGLDSALVFLTCIEAAKILNMDPHDFVELITMPGLGTSQRTLDSAMNLGLCYNVPVRTIDIKPAVAQHFSDIGHSMTVFDACFENAQARERMTCLFDVANMVNGIVVTGSNLSEIMLSWSTFGGDHLGGYCVLSGTPKTLVKSIIAHYIQNVVSPDAARVLSGILETTVSPELLPSIDGLVQSTETSIGPYELHDFFIFHFLRSQFSFKKILVLALHTFSTYEPATVAKWFVVFVERLASGQFKRSVSMPGVKIGTVSASSRGDLRLPDEMSFKKEYIAQMCKEVLDEYNDTP